jgi:hypothetical protein
MDSTHSINQRIKTLFSSDSPTAADSEELRALVDELLKRKKAGDPDIRMSADRILITFQCLEARRRISLPEPGPEVLRKWQEENAALLKELKMAVAANSYEG